MGTFFFLQGGEYRTTTKNILIAKRYFETNPDGKILTGIWTRPSWTKQDFYQWFKKCLNEKTGGADYTERQWKRIRDCRIVNDYYQRRIRRSGVNILTEPTMKRRYPEIDCPVMD